MTVTPSFSLLTQPWIQCVTPTGETAELSLLEVFDGAHPVAGLRGDSPTQDFAVLRVLLAIYWRAQRAVLGLRASAVFDMDDWREARFDDMSEDRPDAPVLDYLHAHADRFDLLHTRTPFMQVADLKTSNGTALPINRIVPEAEGSHFTMRAGDGLETLEFAEASRWLIHVQAFDYSGIKSGAVGDPRVKGGKGYPIGTGWAGMTGGTTVLGESLQETLLLNTTTDALLGSDDDRPVWEREPDGPAERPVSVPAGAADILTWQSRRVKLFHDIEKVTAVLVSNGDRIPEAGANIFSDPMTPYRFSTNKSTTAKSVYYPRPYDTDRMMWRSLEPLIALGGERALAKKEQPPKRPETLDELARAGELGRRGGRVLNLRLTSTAYGPQGSSAGPTVDARIDIPRALLNDGSRAQRKTVLDAARATQDAAIELGRYAGTLLQAAGGDYVFQPAPTDALLSELEPLFRRWLGPLELDRIDAAATSWQRTVRDAVLGRALILLRGAGPRALIGTEIEQNGKAVLVSAGTAFEQLRRRLRDHLPLTAEPAVAGANAPAPSGFPQKENDGDQ